MKKEQLKIVFMGTPDFAVPSLEILLLNDYQVVGVVTVPDKPAGRGLQMHESAVKRFAVQHQLKVLQPQNLKDEHFQQELAELGANLQIVVAFRMLPKAVWQMPSLGTFNLHGSLLPQYRGAAPINWAVINGEKETGVTTFFLKHEIDTGHIVHRAKCPIQDNDTAGNIHDKLMLIGAELVLKTVETIVAEKIQPIPQEQLINEGEVLKPAPKIHKQDCRIAWSQNVEIIHNRVRGLAPFPGAFSEFTDGKQVISIKIMEVKSEQVKHDMAVGTIVTDNKSYLKIAALDGFVHLVHLQMAGKKRMFVEDFLRGYHFNTQWKSASTDV